MKNPMLQLGNKAPHFSLAGDDSRIHSLKDFVGNPLIIFFYPKDFTPGCTTEACEYSTNMDSFLKLSVFVIGISQDGLASHARFKSKHSLRFLLLSDPDLFAHKHYGAFGEKTLYGKTTVGVIRSTFLIDEEGFIVRSWYKVRVKNHVQNVLNVLTKHRQDQNYG